MIHAAPAASQPVAKDTITTTLLRRGGVVGILRASSTQHLMPAARVLVEEGLNVLEFPLTTPGAPDVIRAAVAEFGDDAVVGSGTVLSVEDARVSLEAGAKFLVCPTTSPEVIRFAVDNGLGVLPGVYTPTEAHTALAAGASVVKLFPAVALGPGYLEQIRQPMPDLEVVPTGGVGLAGAREWFDAGAFALGLGSPLSGRTLESGDMDELRRLAQSWVEFLG